MSTAPAPVRRWTDLAACRGHDDVMFPHDEDDEARTAPGKALCADCPARPECLDDAMQAENGDGRNKRHGIRGGLTGAERWRRDRVRIDKPTPDRHGGRQRAACGTPEAAARHRRYKEALCDACKAAADTAQEGS
ncbi:transcription factor WhiB [Streptomyces sp. Amel2xB2]|uniref:WhiB family transcriptional regulator n=1 Tax=Streptomyces sp. Amel2xB2 TaxID=1305829 RepID=UPI000DB9E1B4|nr:WhiB family transcriptional regulator [Streptomyces sp. Amel2xB2]RAJ70216.1 transcription factor WhiB [Streptomyces sp. Amel2xB2]